MKNTNLDKFQEECNQNKLSFPQKMVILNELKLFYLFDILFDLENYHKLAKTQDLIYKNVRKNTEATKDKVSLIIKK